ncbi:hypothetical protein Q9233_017896 [Columba guinea]|nr:hypothetical protein Q9233_017896 [Columba guinea]
MAIWDAVATYIHDHLLSNKGVRIPTLGSFDVVTQQVQVGEEDVTIHRPTFNLARNLVVGHNLVDDKSYLPGNKELEPIKYSKVAATTSVSRRKVEGCVQGTLSLFSYCLGKGQNVALLLKDIGVLLLEATKVDMRFYHHFLEALAGKDNLQKVVFQVGDGGDGLRWRSWPNHDPMSHNELLVRTRRRGKRVFHLLAKARKVKQPDLGGFGGEISGVGGWRNHLGDDGETMLEMVEKARWKWWRNHVGNGGETPLEMMEKTSLEMMEKPRWRWWRNLVGDGGETTWR